MIWMPRRCCRRRWPWPATGWWSSVRARRRSSTAPARATRWKASPAVTTSIRRRPSSPEYTSAGTGPGQWPVPGASGAIGAHEQLHHFLHMRLGFPAIQVLAKAHQQAEVAATLDQAEEVFGGMLRVVDAQLTMGVGQLQQMLHGVDHALRAGIEEQLRQLRIVRALAHHQTMHGQRFLAVDQRTEATADGQQSLFDTAVGAQFKEQRRQLLRAFGLHSAGKQRLLVGEVAVHR